MNIFEAQYLIKAHAKYGSDGCARLDIVYQSGNSVDYYEPPPPNPPNPTIPGSAYSYYNLTFIPFRVVFHGAQGFQGDTGAQGFQGHSGFQGDTGAQGFQGDTGCTRFSRT